MHKKRKIGGFTLIELLIVVAIISLLSSVVFVSLSSARAKGRDAQRKENLKQIQLALELYYDSNGEYPPATAGCFATNWGSSVNCPTNYISGLSSTYINALPSEPVINIYWQYLYWLR